MKRRPLILLILFILLLLTLWLGREGWLPFFKSWLPQLAGDIGSQIQSIEAFVALIVLIGGGIFGSWSWLTRNDQTNRRSEELSPLRATTWQAIRDRSPQGAPIQWIDRGATDANKLRAQPRVALMGLSGEGKTREAAELIRRAVELDLVAETKVFEPNRDFLHAGAALTTAVLDKVVEPTQRACLFIDDLHSYTGTTLEQLATLLALFTHPQVDHRYVIATVRSDLVSAEQQEWLTQQGFHQVRLPKIDARQTEQWLTSAGQMHSLTLSKKVRQTFIEQNQQGMPGHLLRGLLTIKSSLADTNKRQAPIKPAQVIAVMSDLTAQERQALYWRQPLAVYLLTALAHFHAAEVRTAQPLILAYAALHYRRDHRLFSRWQAWWRGQTLRRTLIYLLNFDVSVQNGLIVAPDVLIEGTEANYARQQVGNFLVAYRRPLHNRLLRRFHCHAEAQRWALFDLAQGYQERHEHAAAAHLYTTAIQVAPHFGFYINRGNTRADQGRLNEAIADYDQSIAINPHYAKAYNNRGIAQKDFGDLAAAIADFGRAIILDPQFATAFYNRGIACYEQGRFDNAIKDFNQAIVLNPQYTTAYNNRGNAHKAQGRFNDAIKDFNQAIALDPQHAITFYNRGVAHYDQGNWPAAIADFDQAIALNPQYAIAYNNRGNAHKAQGDWPAAIADFDQAITLDTQFAEAFGNRSLALRAVGDLAGAADDLTKATQLFTTDSDKARAYEYLGDIYKDANRGEEAVIAYVQALALGRGTPALLRKTGSIYRRLEQWSEAIDIYRQAVASDGQELWDWVALADVARRAGDEQIWREATVQARSRLSEDDAYGRTCVESVAGNVEEAMAALTQAAQAAEFDATWARQDPNLAWVRADSRFEELVGKIIDKKDIGTDELEQAEGEKQVAVVETKSANKM